MKRVFLLFLILCSVRTFSQTVIDDGSLVNGIWTKSGSPYLIGGNIMIGGGETLTIEPGVEVNFQGAYSLLIMGRLVAEGSSTDSIVFTTNNTAAGWRGMHFENIPANTDSSILKFCKIEYSYSLGWGQNGGGIIITNSPKISITRSNIRNCSSAGHGAAIYAINSKPVIANNNISFNHSGAGAVFTNGGATITNNYISYNDNNYISDGPSPGLDPDFYAGGLACYGENTIVSNNVIVNNTSASNGGGVTVGGDVQLVNNVISNNNAEGNGGGIYCLDCRNVSKNTISNNTAATSAGIHIYNNRDIDHDIANIDSNIITSNTAQYAGGGLSIEGGWQIYLTRNRICNNTVTTSSSTSQGGGGVWVTNTDDNTVQFTDNIIANNNSVIGGGILCVASSTASFFNNTIVNNAASSKGGGLYFYSGSPTFYSNIVWGNTAVAANGGNQVYLFNDASDPNFYYNDIQGASAGFGKNGTFYLGTYQNNTNANPGFISPTAGSGNSHNGLTANWALSDTSKCLNAGLFGQSPTTVLWAYPEEKDAAGNQREVNCKIDMGAIENQVHLTLPSSIGFTVSDYNYSFYTDTLYTNNNPSTLQSVITSNLTNWAQFNTHYWSTGDTTLSILITKNGLYKSRATSTTGCSVSDSTLVILKPSANFTINKDTQCLANNNFIFTSSTNVDTANYNYKWSFGDNLINTNYTASHTYTTGGSYPVKLIVSQKKNPGYKDSLIKTIIVDPFIYNSLPDTTIVEDDSVIIEGGSGFASYLWNNSNTSQSIIVKEKGWYKITVTNNNGCTATDSSYILFKKRKTLYVDKSINNCPNAPGVSVSIRTINCTNIVGLQGTINWDNTKLKFNNIVYNSSNINITASDLNLSQTNNGTMTLSWLDNTLTGKNEIDSTKLFSLNFDILPGNPLGSQIPITFDSIPTALEIDTVNLSTNNLVKVPDSKFVNGYVEIAASPQTINVTMEACDSLIYKSIKYISPTSIVDTLKYVQGCDSIYKNISIVIYHAPITPTISINANYSGIINYGEHVVFTALVTKGGPSPLFKWYKNGVVINGANSSSYSTDTLNANDTIQASIVSSFSCAVHDTIFSNKFLLDVYYLVSGHINHILGTTVPNTILNFNTINYSPVSSNSFSRYLIGGRKYKFKFNKNNDVLKTNGVSTLDIALVQSHILNISPLNDPYKLLAADVDKNGEISALDILHIRRLILGITSSFPSNNLWLFFDSTNINKTNPYPVKDSIVIDSLMSAVTNIQFVGVKLGDVNFDWNPAQARPLPLTTTPITFYHSDITVGNNREIRIPIRVKDFKDIIALQYTMSFNTANIQFAGIENNLLNIQFNSALSTDGKITFIWNDPKNNAVNLDDNTIIMEIVFNKLSDFSEESISLNSSITSVEAWDSKLQKHMINKGRGKIINTINWSVAPNPTKGEINLNLISSKNKQITISLQDVTGKKIATYPVQLVNGNNLVKLNLKKTAHIVPGTYYITTNDVENKMSQKIIVQ
ncbi:MAG: right-handed parallel beta-helix repeat-containing protein [Bacteroidota bacterium]